MERTTRQTWLFLPAAIVLLLAAIVGMWRLEVESIWHDEAWSIRAIRSPFGTPDDNTPYLYYVTLHLLQRMGVGETSFALRYGSVLIFVVTVAVGFRTGARWYGQLGGLTSGMLLALSPLLWEYAQEIRAYVAVPLITLALLAGCESLLKFRSDFRQRTWGFLLITEIAALYTHNLMVPVIIWLNLVVITVIIADKATWRLLQWSGTQAILFALYLPWLLTQSPSGTTLNTRPAFNLDLLRNVWEAYNFPVNAPLPESMVAGTVLLAILTVIAIVLLVRRRSLRSAMLLSQALLLPVFTTGLLIRASIDFHPRYYVAGVPALILILAGGIDKLAPGIRWGAAAVVLALSALVSYQSLKTLAGDERYQHDNFQQLAAYYAQLPPNAVILIPFDDEPALQAYYADKMGIQARFLNLPLYSTPQTAIDTINAALANFDEPVRVEVLTWYQLPADERGMLRCLLAASGTDKLIHFETYGLASTGYTLSAVHEPASPGETVSGHAFKGALQMDAIHYVANGAYTCVQSSWTLEAPAPGETYDDTYSAAVRILNPFGWELAASDGQILTDNQMRVKDWGYGQQGAAFTLLEIPQGTPARYYDWLIRLYSPGQASGWDVLNEDGQPLGKDLRPSPLTLPGNPVVPVPQTAAIVRDSSRAGQLYSGERLEVELLHPLAESATIRLENEGFTLEQVVDGNPGLAWLSFILPADAQGEAQLLWDESVISTYTIIQTDRVFAQPEIDTRLDSEIPGIGTLVGVNLPQEAINAGESLEIEVIWQAAQTQPADYTVFVQLLAESGRLLAQSDSQPAAATRPTSGWIPGEYITDPHILQWNDLEYRGAAIIIVGMYNAIDGTRIVLLDGSDAVVIPVEVTVR